MNEKSASHLVYVDRAGNVACAERRGTVRIPVEFDEVMNELTRDLQLALDCIQFMGGVPIPVAKAILRNIEPAHAAIDFALKQADSGKENNLCSAHD